MPEDSFYSDVPTFPEFVDYLIGTPVTQYNEHWQPFYIICSPCEINYNIILKLESIDEDSDMLVYRTGLPELKPKLVHKTPQSHLSNLTNNKTEDSHHENVITLYFSQVSDRQILKLYDIFKIDFEMFDYDIDTYLKISQS